MAPRRVRGASRCRAGGARHKTRRAVLVQAFLGLGLFRAEPARAASIRLLALGDSLTAGYGLPQGQGFVPQLQAALRAHGHDAQVLDAGVSGDTTAGGLARLDWALADQPQAAIVELGGNDGLRGLPPRETRANLDAILSRLKARGVPTLLAGMLAPPNLGADYGREFAEVFKSLARDHPEVVFYPFFLEGVAADPALNQPDGIHPNAKGVEVIVRRILPAVETLLGRVSQAPAG
ncbi:MAG: arylesterase [Acetobacteraceae bacterium]|nr:arylesterase [Acetobacteraceae bacterium]